MHEILYNIIYIMYYIEYNIDTKICLIIIIKNIKIFNISFILETNRKLDINN